MIAEAPPALVAAVADVLPDAPAPVTKALLPEQRTSAPGAASNVLASAPVTVEDVTAHSATKGLAKPETAPPPGSAQGATLAPSSDGVPELTKPDELAFKPVRSDPETAIAGAAPTVQASSVPATQDPSPAPARANATTLAILADQMARKLDGGSTRFDIELNPEGLGRVDVRLDIDSTGGVRAAFTFETRHAAGELSRRSDELQKSLESAGFNLSGGLSFDVAGDRSQGRGAAWSDQTGGRPSGPLPAENEPLSETGSVITNALTGRSWRRSGVDIRI
ncbi:MAG: flagellar hook-length control protein FliK [Phenylobacterium sp.]